MLVKRFITKSAGYALLVDRHQLAVPELRRRSLLRSDSSPRRLEREQGSVEVESFPASFERGDDDFDHLVFALKYDGIELAVLARIFLATDARELARRIADAPTSKYGRQLFFLYELLTRTRLDLPDAPPAGHVAVLDPSSHYTSAGRPSPRHRVLDNLLGDASFCPIVRRTAELDRCVAREFGDRAARIVAGADPPLLARAIRFLYTKETKSSFAIEHEEPGDKEARFVANLGRIASLPLEDETGLTELQNSIVDPRYREAGFRKPGDREVWVGQSLFGGREKVHHIGARSAVTPDLMNGLLRMREVEGPGAPVIEAAAKSFAFVFIHPFGDGNGRIHRLLLHHILAQRGFLPRNLVVPISAVIVSDPRGYDEVLEDFSARVLPLIEYRFEDKGGDTTLTILNQPDDFYRYPDLTRQCEATFAWLGRAIEEDLVQELEFLRNYDEIRARVRDIVEMPDRKEQLFIKLLMHNRGKLAKHKRRLFAELEDEVIAALEAAAAERMRAD
jgi:hypothetical protein